jgi:TonB family protein
MTGPERITCALRIAITLASFLLAGAVARAQAQPVRPLPEPELRGFASRFLHDKGEAGCKPPNCSILVADFTNASGETSQLGIELADQIAEDFASLLGATEIINRTLLHTYLERARIPADLLNNDDAMRWLGKELGATTILTGTAESQDGKLRLTARWLSADSKWSGPKEDLAATYHGDLAADLAPLDPFSSHNPVPDSVAPAGVVVAGKNGVTNPTCVYCPAPSYSPAARSAKFQGTLVLTVVVTAGGRASSVVPLRGAPFGLNEAAISAIQWWQFNPAMKDGHTVAVTLPIEITLHLY